MNNSTWLQIWTPLIAVSLAIFMVTLDGTMMNIALFDIVKDFQTDLSNIQGAIVLHSLMMASLYLTGGKLGDVYGKKKIFRLGIVLFGLGTLIATLSPNAIVLTIGWSIIKTIGGMMIVPTTLALIVVNYSQARRAFAFGIYAAVTSMAILVGPLLMGFFTTHWTWRLGFALEPLLALSIFGLIFSIRETETLDDVEFDYVGSLLSALGIGTLVMASSLASRYGWWIARRPFSLAGVEISPFGLSLVPFLLVVGVLILVAFINWEDTRVTLGKLPLFQGGFFGSRQYTFGLLTNASCGISIAGFLFIVPVFLQSLGLTGLETGIILLPYSVSLSLFSLTTASLSQKIPPKYIIQFGLVLMLTGVWMTYDILTVELTAPELFWGFVLFGSGTGIVLAQVSNVPLSAVPPSESGTASGVLETTREMGIAFGVAVIGGVLIFSMYSHLTNGILKQGEITVDETTRQEIIIFLEDTLGKAKTPQQEDKVIAQLPEKVQQSIDAFLPSVLINAQKTTLVTVFDFLLFSLFFSAFLPQTKLKPKTTSGA